MGIKIVLTALPYYNHVYAPSIQLGYLKSYLEQDSEISVRAIDSELIFFNSDVIRKNAQLYLERIGSPVADFGEKEKHALESMVKAILSEKPDAVGFSVIHANYEFTRYIAKRLKETMPSIFIIYGGLRFCMRDQWSHYVYAWHKDLSEVDCIIKGEGELTFMELAQSLKKGIIPDFCAGTTLRKNGTVMDCGLRPLVEDLDSIPFPDFKDFPKEDYLSNYTKILFSRGCPGRCAFCTENYTMGMIRSRSPENIIKEIKLRLSHGYTKFQACDFALNSDISCLKKVCKTILEEKIRVEFVFGQFRHSTNMDKEVFCLLRKSGFDTIYFGTETASQSILNKMSKGVKVKTIENNIKDASKEGLKTVIFLMVGFPGETEDTFLESVVFIKNNAKYINAVQHVAPVTINAGSRIHDNLSLYGLDKTTLFKNPDIWESLDGKNNFEWRYSLKERMQRCLNESGISDVVFSEDGNPRISGIPVRVNDFKAEIERIRDLSEKNKKQL